MANGVRAIEIALPEEARPAPRGWPAALWRFASRKPLGAAGGLLVLGPLGVALLLRPAPAPARG